MPERCGIACAGNWIIDHVKIIDVWPPEGTLAYILDQYTGTGGAPYNVGLDLRALDPRLPLQGIGLVGDDADGRYILEDLRRHDIDASSVAVTRALPTSFTDVMTVKTTKVRTFFHEQGANRLLGPEHFDFSRVGARLFHLGYLLLLETLDGEDGEYGTRAARVLHQARAAGLEVSVEVVSDNTERFPRIVRAALPHADYLSCNEIEAQRTTGLVIRRPDGSVDPDALRRAARALLEGGVRRLVCVHMPEGGYALDAHEHDVFQPSLNLPDDFVAGTVGAGDAFTAGLLYGLHERWDLPRCLLLAVSAAAASLAHPTATGGVKPVKETLALSQRYGFLPTLPAGS